VLKSPLLVLRSIPVVVGIAMSLLLSSCGTATQQYPSYKKLGVYFAVPNSWHEITSKQLSAQEALATDTSAKDRAAMVQWQDAFTTDKTITAADVFNLKSVDAPVAFVRVRSLFPDETNSVSNNSLRNMVVPLTTWVNSPTATTPVYEIFDDQDRIEKGARGVRTVFSFTLNGEKQSIDQTALLSPDRSTIYVLLIRCSSLCFEKNKSAITKIAESFTVRGK
jgi:hypothetical protein